VASIYAASDGAVYEKSMGRWSQRLAMPFIRFSEIGASLHSALDVGCGTGSLTFALGRIAATARITGLDHSQAFVDYARSQSCEDRFSFDQGDAVSLPYKTASFDAAMSQLVLSFLGEPERAVREMVRVTRSGGVVAAAVWDFFGGHTFSRILLDTAAPLDPGAAALRAKHCSQLTRPGEMAAMWRRVGLRDVEQSEVTIRMDFASFNDLWEPWLGGQGTVGAYLIGLNDQKRRLIEYHTRQAYLVGEPDGPRSIAATAWVVRGTAQ
jgi:ubiquinone/menaquinone biosynthesis C-methylase UbiE